MRTIGRRGLFLSLILGILLGSCSTGTPQSTPQAVSVYSSYSARSWLEELYDCAAQSSAIIRLSDSPSDADIRLQIGEPAMLSSFAYQIDTEEILIATHRQSPIQNMDADQVRALFAGQGDLSVQVWVYASGEDIQQVFDQTVMKGKSVTSLARLAVNLQQMSDALNNQPNSVGILPKRWNAGDARFVYTIPDVPVLAITQNEPQGAVKSLIGCLQAK